MNSIMKEMKELIHEHMRLSLKSSGSSTNKVERCILKEVSILSKDIDESIRYIVEDCNADEYGFLSRILPDLIKHTNDKRFIDCFKRLEEKYTTEFYCYFVDCAIKEAEKLLI
mgnify:CR=1 FL=1